MTRLSAPEREDVEMSAWDVDKWVDVRLCCGRDSCILFLIFLHTISILTGEFWTFGQPPLTNVILDQPARRLTYFEVGRMKAN